MSVEAFLQQVRADARFMSKVATWRTLPGQPASYGPLPDALHPALRPR
jgi:hypothetical protein